MISLLTYKYLIRKATYLHWVTGKCTEKVTLRLSLCNEQYENHEQHGQNVTYDITVPHDRHFLSLNVAFCLDTTRRNSDQTLTI